MHRNLHIWKVREVVSCLLYEVNFSVYEPAAINRYLAALSGALALIRAAAFKIRRAFIAKLSHQFSVLQVWARFTTTSPQHNKERTKEINHIVVYYSIYPANKLLLD